jgi:GNAT superfamily N-acetyltransferase
MAASPSPPPGRQPTTAPAAAAQPGRGAASNASPVIRAAQGPDLKQLARVEVAGGQRFHEVGVSSIADDTPDPVALREALTGDRLWVAEVDDEVVGYVQAELLDGHAQVAQVSVVPQFAGRGIGRLLIHTVEEWASRCGCRSVTLTTFRDVPWNGSYYAKLGYRVLTPDRIGPDVARVIEHEATLPGLADAPRVAMTQALPA